MAASATLHCLTGCAIGEVLGLIIGTILHLPAYGTTALAICLAFFFGYLLSALPLIRSGVKISTAYKLVLAADSLSIATMELVDNLVMYFVPGAMNSTLVNPIFWLAMPLALTVAFFAALPVNRYLLGRNKGHAITMRHMDERQHHESMRVSPLVYGLVAFFTGGLLVSVAAHTFDKAELQDYSSWRRDHH